MLIQVPSKAKDGNFLSDGEQQPDLPRLLPQKGVSYYSFAASSLWGKNDQPNIGHFQQGELGDCWLAGTLQGYVLKKCGPDFIKNLITPVLQPESNKRSRDHYDVHLYRNGQPVTVRVDSSLPATANGNRFLMGSNAEIGGALIEKAVAKLYGGYDALDKKSMCEGCSLFHASMPPMHNYNWRGSNVDPRWYVNKASVSESTYWKTFMVALSVSGTPADPPPVVGLNFAQDFLLDNGTAFLAGHLYIVVALSFDTDGICTVNLLEPNFVMIPGLVHPIMSIRLTDLMKLSGTLHYAPGPVN